jgi:ABC-type multidrug transport system permease subunit
MPDTRVPHPIVELTLARFREFLREPEAMFWTFAFPVLMTCALGLAFRSQAPKPVPIGVAEGEGRAALVERLRASADLEVRDLAGDALERALRSGGLHLVVVPGTPATLRFDPTRPESRLARLAVLTVLSPPAADAPPTRDDRVSARGARYIDWLVPGLLGLNIMSTGLWGIGFSIVQARTRKLLKRLVATPMRRSHYLLGHVLSRLAFLVLEVATLITFALLVFGVPFEGSVWQFIALCVLGAAAFGGIGLLIASRARTVEAVSGLMNIVMLPMWLLSGVFFSADNFPRVMQPAIRALPLTALNDALRATMIDGAGLAAVAGQMAVLATWGLACFVVALRIFRWR